MSCCGSSIPARQPRPVGSRQPFRLDPELRAAVEARATADQTTTSDVISEAFRRFLDVLRIGSSKAGIGRTGRPKGGAHWSTTVNHGQQRSLENRA
jgi:hypothetical protein